MVGSGLCPGGSRRLQCRRKKQGLFIAYLPCGPFQPLLSVFVGLTSQGEKMQKQVPFLFYCILLFCNYSTVYLHLKRSSLLWLSVFWSRGGALCYRCPPDLLLYIKTDNKREPKSGAKTAKSPSVAFCCRENKFHPSVLSDRT